jgi:hypothetical protein
MLPHGKGTVKLQCNESLKCYGVFEHGSLALDLICRSKEEDVIDADDDSQLKNIPDNRRAPQEPTGVVIDDIPLNPSSQNSQQRRHIHQTHKKKVAEASGECNGF